MNRVYNRIFFTLCSIIATNTITSTSVFEVDTAAPSATPSAEKKKIQIRAIKNFIIWTGVLYSDFHHWEKHYHNMWKIAHMIQVKERKKWNLGPKKTISLSSLFTSFSILTCCMDDQANSSCYYTVSLFSITFWICSNQWERLSWHLKFCSYINIFSKGINCI